ncbi:hypothetical protein ABVT39_018233 [Epinephelus coioides]
MASEAAQYCRRRRRGDDVYVQRHRMLSPPQLGKNPRCRRGLYDGKQTITHGLMLHRRNT